MKRIVVATVISGVLALWMGHSAVAGETGIYLGVTGVGWNLPTHMKFGNKRDVVPVSDQPVGTEADIRDKDTAKLNGKKLGGLVRIGYDAGMARIDLEAGYRYSDELVTKRHPLNDEGHIYLYTAMANIILEPWTFNSLTPYMSVGGGMLYAHGNIKYDRIGPGNDPREDVDFREVTAAGQLGLGVAYELSPGIDVVAGYSAMVGLTDKATANGQFFLLNNVNLGLNYTF